MFNKEEKINKTPISLSNGTYVALWSGYDMKVLTPNGLPTVIETTIGVKGIDCEVTVRVVDGEVYYNGK